MISIACKGRNLGDLRICFGRDLKLQACGVNETQQKLCSSDKIVMPPVRLGSGKWRNGNAGYQDDPNEAGGDDRNEDQNENENQGEDRD